MLGILRKDLYDTFLIPKNILSNGIGYFFMFLFAYLMGPNLYMLMAFVMVALPATSVMILQDVYKRQTSGRSEADPRDRPCDPSGIFTAECVPQGRYLCFYGEAVLDDGHDFVSL